MVTDTGAWSEIVYRVLQPGEGYAPHTHIMQHGIESTHTPAKIDTGIRARGEACALSNLITSTGPQVDIVSPVSAGIDRPKKVRVCVRACVRARIPRGGAHQPHAYMLPPPLLNPTCHPGEARNRRTADPSRPTPSTPCIS